MTDQTKPWPIETGDLAMALVVQMLKRLNGRDVLSVEDIKTIFEGAVAGAGGSDVQERVRQELNTLFPHEVQI